MLRALARVVCVCLLLGACARPAAAQGTVNNGSISGRVTDESGGTVPGATVTARQTETNVKSTAVTSQDGRFRFPYLQVGPYEITVELTGFKTQTRTLTLGVGAAFDLPIVLTVAMLTETFVLRAEGQVLETARTQMAGTVSQAEIVSVPLNGRQFLDLALLVPGVSPTNVGGGTQLFAETSAVPGVGLSISSQRNFSNNFIVDGLSANDDAAGLSGMPYGVDALDQFQVITSGGNAELGRALGGYISVVTRSGTNLLRGDLYGYLRDDRFNAANALSKQKLPMNQGQYGFSTGGPVVRDRTFFFGNVEHRRLRQTGLVTIAAEAVQTINARLLATGYAGPLVTTGNYANPVDTTNAVGKVDHQAGNRDRVTVRYSLYDAKAQNSRGAGALSAPSASSALDNRDQTIAVSNIVTIGSHLVNETRAQYADSTLLAPPSDPLGPAVTITNVASFGTLSTSPTGRANGLFEVVNNLSYQAGAHAFRVGVDALYNDLTITFPRAIRGSYSFPTLNAFLAGAYSSTGFTQTFGDRIVTLTNPNVGVYVQDEWRAATSLTLNAGLRYDLQWMPTIETDADNLSPRLGFAWSPGADGRTVLRGSAGLFYDRVPLRALANALLSAGNTTDLAALRQVSVVLAPTQAAAPAFPNTLAAPVPLVTLVNFTTMDRRLQNANSVQASLELERQIGDRNTVSVGYEQLRGRHLIMQVNQNVPSCAPVGNNNGCRPNPAFANNNQYSSVGSSESHALRLSFVRRPSNWGSVRVSYTFAKAMNDVGEAFFNGPIDPFDFSKDWGRSDDDQRHRLVVSGAVNTSTAAATSAWQQVSHGWQFSAMLQYYSALPFNIVSGVNTIQGTAGRPIVDGQFIPRNAGIGSDFFSLGVRASRTFKMGSRLRVETLVEGFNITNRANTLTRKTSFGTGAYPANPLPDFGQVTAVGDPRSVQFGIRAKF